MTHHNLDAQFLRDYVEHVKDVASRHLITFSDHITDPTHGQEDPA